MKKKIQYIIHSLKVVYFDELLNILKVKNKTLKKNLEELLKERAILQIENYFIPGPNIEVDEIFEIKEKLQNFNIRNIDWKTVSKFLEKELKEETDQLLDDIKNLREEPKKLELRYFDLSLKYHEILRFFEENHEKIDLNLIYQKLTLCRKFLDKLEY